MKLAPIALFIYNRPEHTRKALEALKKNELAKDSVLFVYADGPKDNATTQELLKIEGLKIYGTAKNKTSVISFNIDGIHPYDIGSILDKLGIAVRTGHHCAQPIMDFYKIPGTVRASFAFYNTIEEVDVLVAGVLKAKSMLL